MLDRVAPKWPFAMVRQGSDSDGFPRSEMQLNELKYKKIYVIDNSRSTIIVLRKKATLKKGLLVLYYIMYTLL